MKERISPIIQVNELMLLKASKDLVLIDARSGAEALDSYNKAHLDGAMHVDLDNQLSDSSKEASNGGRHPLPSIEDFAATLGNLGIDSESHIVIYDDKNGANAAARLWWMLRSIGHQKAQVLNGGLKEAIKNQYPINNNEVIPNKKEPYSLSNWKLPTADLKEIQENSLNPDYLLIDVRQNARYKGEIEPIDRIAGHIPGAINIPFSSNLNEEGLFLSPAELKEKYLRLLEPINDENIAIHCGSGVTACHSLLAIDYAGLPIPKLYVGSWSEWSRNDLDIATGD